MTEPTSREFEPNALVTFLVDYRLSFDKGSALHQAIVHSSYAFEAGETSDNERLEFLGDAILGMLVSEALFERHAQAPEGELTRRRARLVSRKALGRVGRKLDLGKHLLLGRGEDQTGGRQRLSILGSSVEALLGGIFRERGLDACRDFVNRFIMAEDTEETGPGRLLDAKSLLQETMQQQRQMTPMYRLVESSGPDHERLFVVEVLVGDKVLGRGTGSRIKTAENDAATRVLKDLDALPNS